ncbi:TAF6-like RNA polymerase II p300/CBP-associated factor-associated factor 65 kDa subunit 6L isoform X2 [Nematostella vectensis]|nr:TAF6-like RNA polymerase II p300/CBP-associated factor-associated factor 65 kDa subunit 6L isoform X2 [Nematostella vectensis]
MKHGKRRRMTTEDLNRAMQLTNVEPVYGYGSGEDMPFRSTSTKEGDVFFVDEKEIGIRELALSTAVPTDPGKVSVRAQWLCVEGTQLSSNNGQHGRLSKNSESDGQQKTLSEAGLEYYEQITKAVLGESDVCRRMAFSDLQSNPKISCIFPYFVSFIASGVKSCSHDLKQLSRLLGMVSALTDNSSLFLDPYVIQLVTAVMYCLLETLTVSLNPVNDHWRLRRDAACVLAFLSRKCSNPVNYLHQQLLMTLREVLTDESRPYCSHYGAVVGLMELGSEALEQFLLPHLSTYWHQLQQVLEDDSSSNGVLRGEAIHVYAALLQAAGCLLQANAEGVIPPQSYPVNNSTHSMLRTTLSSWPGISTGNERRPAPISSHSRTSRSSSVCHISPSQCYAQLYEIFGDSLLPYTGVNNWQDNATTKNHLQRIQPFAHAYFPLRPLQRDTIMIRKLIEKARQKHSEAVRGGRSPLILGHGSRKRPRTVEEEESSQHEIKRERHSMYSSLALKPKTSHSLVAAGVFEFVSPPRKVAEHNKAGKRKGGRQCKRKSAEVTTKEEQMEVDDKGHPLTGSVMRFRRSHPVSANKMKFDYHIGVTL